MREGKAGYRKGSADGAVPCLAWESLSAERRQDRQTPLTLLSGAELDCSGSSLFPLWHLEDTGMDVLGCHALGG